jgi:hypothetical protein
VARTRATATTSDRDLGFAEIKRRLGDAKGAFCEAGWWGDKKTKDGKASLAYVASIMEFGTRDGKIPERAFVRPTCDMNGDKYRKRLAEAGLRIVRRKSTADQELAAIGERIASDIQEAILSLWTPELAASTKQSRRHKRGSVRNYTRRQAEASGTPLGAGKVFKPLIDTGTLLASISTRVFVRGRKTREKRLGKVA